MKILITGIAGFVGSSIAERILTATPHSVVGVDRVSDYYDTAFKHRTINHLRSLGAEIEVVDINDTDGSLLSGVDVIIHQAGQPGVRKSWGHDFQDYLHDNVAGTQHLLELAKGADLKRFIYASSSSVYGDAEAYPTSETVRPQPLSPYGVTKLAAEHLCVLYARNFNVPTVSLRYFTVYGPRQRPDMAFNRFITAALTGGTIQIHGDGTQVREFTHVSDIVTANLAAIEAPLEPGDVINLSGGSSVSVNEVLELLRRIHGRDLDIVYGGAVAGDVARTSGDTARAKKHLGWVPTVSIEQGLLDEYRWLTGVYGKA